MLTLTNFLNNACTGALALEALQGALQGFVLTDAYLGHLISLLSLISPCIYR